VLLHSPPPPPLWSLWIGAVGCGSPVVPVDALDLLLGHENCVLLVIVVFVEVFADYTYFLLVPLGFFRCLELKLSYYLLKSLI
jgi:hypothetical protein